MTKHCKTCVCDGKPEMSDERIRQRKLFSRVPDTGCLDHRAGKYCGNRCVPGALTDRCKEHNHR